MPTTPALSALIGSIDSLAGRLKELRGTSDLSEYLRRGGNADEETVTEPLLGMIIEDVLGFPKDAYFPQLSRRGRKPDFTPVDLVAHSFVLDAKSTDEDLAAHYDQIRDYMEQRSLSYGILFNLREVHVYRLGDRTHLADLSFSVAALWEYVKGASMDGGELAHFKKFVDHFRYRSMSLEDKVEYIRHQEAWGDRIASGAPVSVDIEFLVDRLHSLARDLTDDAAGQVDELERLLSLQPGRGEKVLGELRILALDIAPKSNIESLPVDIDGWRNAGSKTAAGRAWRQFLARAAYLALIRILLYRTWEDVEFVDGTLYDGGFDRAYDRLNGDLQRILKEAFLHGAERYRWLYGSDNNYDWYRPRDERLIEVLYALAPVPLGKLDADVLGNLYEAYVDEVDRDRLGQFFTPRSVVRFMLDKVGFSGQEAIFDIAGNQRKPKRLFDFATGSGGFLVEAARRIIDDSGIDLNKPADRDEALAALVRGLSGGEISPFPYYLTEVNLLLQVSRVLGRMTLDNQEPPPFTLGVLHMDSLATRSIGTQSLEGIEVELQGDRGVLLSNDSYDLVPFDEEKRVHHREVLRNDVFDYVVGNPPYVAEANNKVLFGRLQSLAAWKGTYQGKTDYLYYFLILAAEKLKTGGRMCVIVPAGWCNAGNADFLREKLADVLTIEEMYLFGPKRMFAPEHGDHRRGQPPTVETLIFVARKGKAPARHRVRIAVLEDERELARHVHTDSERAEVDRDDLLTYMSRRLSGRAPRYGRRDGVLSHDRPQSDFKAGRPWPIKHNREDIGALAVAHLDEVASARSSPVEPLENQWKIFQGIQTGADAYTKRIDKRLSEHARAEMIRNGCRIGDPIMELPPSTGSEAPWSDHPELLCRSPESRAILYGAVDDDDYVSYVRIARDTPVSDDVQDALRRWKPLLESRAAIARDPNRRWYETAWARDLGDLNAPKVIALYRTDRGRFALDEDGDLKPSIKGTAVVGKQPDAPVAYLCGLLNSELLDLWYAVRGKTPYDVRRNYEPKPMAPMPYRRPEGDPRADEIAGLVREVASNRRALLPHRKFVQDLGRIIKDPWRTGPVVVDVRALLDEAPAATKVSLRLHADAQAVPPPNGEPARLNRKTETEISLTRGRKPVGSISGPPDVLDLILELTGTNQTTDIERIVVPKDIKAFRGSAEALASTVFALLNEGRRLVERIERLVCALYEVPDDLTQAVIDHAITRAARGAPQDAEE